MTTARTVASVLAWRQFLDLPGTAGNYASTPDSAANSITGDIDVRVRLRRKKLAPSSFQTLIAKAGSDNTSFSLRLKPDTGLDLILSEDGLTANRVFKGSGDKLNTFYGNDDEFEIRFTIDFTASELKFWHRIEEQDAWLQLGSAATPGVTALFDATSALGIGGESDGSLPANGGILRAQMYNGIDGTLAVDFNASDTIMGDTSFVSSTTGETWTINGSDAVLTGAA